MQLKTTKIGTVSSKFIASSTNYVSSTTVTGAISTESIIRSNVLRISGVISGYVSFGNVGNIVPSSTPNYGHLSTSTISDGTVATSEISSEVSAESLISGHFIPSSSSESEQITTAILSHGSIVQSRTAVIDASSSESISSSTDGLTWTALIGLVIASNDVYSNSVITSQVATQIFVSQNVLSASNINTRHVNIESMFKTIVPEMDTTALGDVSNETIHSVVDIPSSVDRNGYILSESVIATITVIASQDATESNLSVYH